MQISAVNGIEVITTNSLSFEERNAITAKVLGLKDYSKEIKQINTLLDQANHIKDFNKPLAEGLYKFAKGIFDFVDENNVFYGKIPLQAKMINTKYNLDLKLDIKKEYFD